MAGLVQEFREFAVKGNAMDMAVGIILGVAFNNVVQSLVNDIIMPPIGLAIGGVDFSDLAIVLKSAVVNDAGEIITPAVAIGYGSFINNLINFFVVAFSAFMIVKVMNRLIRKREAEVAA